MSETRKNKGGRPPVHAEPITVRVPPALLCSLNSYIDRQAEPKPSRPEAIRQLLADALDRLSDRTQGTMKRRDA
jgi:hypothetical protein